MINDPQLIKKIFNQNNSFLLTTHVNPDGDAIGSLLALGLSLRNMGKKVDLVTAQSVPDCFLFLPGSRLILQPQGISREVYDVGIVLDCSDLKRIGEDVEQTLKRCYQLVNIDHHISNSFFGDINYIDPQAAATAEILWEITKEIGLPISSEIVTNLYTAMITDTGSFQYANASPKCHRTTAELLEKGADRQLVCEALYEYCSLTSLRLLERSLATLTLHQNKRIAWMTVSSDFLKETGALPEDCEGFVNYPKSLAGVELAILFKEFQKNEVKISFRSKRFLDVNGLAKHFDGGGHERAAGCTVQGTLDTVVRQVISYAETFLQEHGEGNY